MNRASSWLLLVLIGCSGGADEDLGRPARLVTGEGFSCVSDAVRRVTCWGDAPVPHPEDDAGFVRVRALDGAVELAARRALCGRFADGTVRCTPIGDGAARVEPARVAGIDDAVALAVGGEEACVVTTAGAVRCWDASTAPRDVEGLPAVKALSAGATHACATTGRELWCWGRSEVFHSALSDAATPVRLPDHDGLASISVSGHGCGLRDDHAVCWGYGMFGQLGDGTMATHDEPAEVVGVPTAEAVQVGGGSTCLLRRNGDVHCFGHNQEGQVGDGTREDRTRPAVEPIAEHAMEIAVGPSHTCVRDWIDDVSCWGDDRRGQVRAELSQYRPAPESSTDGLVEGIGDATSVGMGDGFACARRRSGAVSCWGRLTVEDADGREEVVFDTASPVPLELPSSARQVGVGVGHVCALLDDGSVVCVGNNLQGELGIGTRRASVEPVAVEGLSDVEHLDVAGGRACTLAGGTVKCWGALPGRHALVPETLPMRGVVQLAVGELFDCVRLSDGAVQCWGDDLMSGGLRSDVWTVPNIDDAVDLSVGSAHACVRNGDDSVVCFGHNEAAQVGRRSCPVDAPCPPVQEPVPFVPARETTAFRATGSATCVWTDDEAARCIGLSDDFTLHDPDRDGLGIADPVELPFSNGIVDIAIGRTSCLLRRDGRIACWGDNSDGQVGAGIRSFVTEPVRVAVPRAYR